MHSQNYISIGETSLIRQRGNKNINIAPYGTMRDYVPFYFGLISPMLYCIQNGFDVPQISPENIIYLLSSIEKLTENNCQFVFTDGHAYAAFTQFYNNINDLNQVDWNTVNLVKWFNTDSDPDRKRRKEAECLVYKSLPLNSIIAVGVYNKNGYDYIANVLHKYNSQIQLLIKREWYY